MALKFSAAARTAAMNAVVDLMDAGSGAGVIKIYDGTPPANGDTAVTTQVLLATFTCADPAFEAAGPTSVAIDADPDLTAVAVATGTATWARATDSDGNVVFDGTVGTSATDFIINTTSIAVGQTVTLTAGTINLPA